MCRSPADRFRTALIVLCLSPALAGCRSRTVSSSVDDDARRYARLAVALGERDADSLDFYAGPDDLVAQERRNPPSLQTIKREAAELTARLSRQGADDSAGNAGTARIRTLLDNLAALEARADLLIGVRMPYDRESTTFFGLAPRALDERKLDDIRARTSDIVGHSGRLVDRYAAFAAGFVIPPERLAAVIDAAVAECRRRTVAQLNLPAAERVAIEFVSNKPWSAFSRYRGGFRSVIQINGDFRFTVDQVLQLACHEAYPGHHTRNVLLASAAPADSERPERWVQLTFSPASLLSEAAAMRACDTAFTDAERVSVERSRLFPLAGLDARDVERHVTVERLIGELQVVQADIAKRYLDGELEFARAVAAVEDRALVPRGEATIKYMNEYRTYVTTYTAGPGVLAERLASCGGPSPTENQRWRCFGDAMLKPRLEPIAR